MKINILDKKVAIILIALLFALFLIVRLIHLSADPPVNLSWSAALFGDEGAYAYDARNKVLFGKWITDDWKSIIYSPILNSVTYLTFKIFGVGLVQLRLINIMASFTGLVLLFLMLRKSAGGVTALLTVFFLGFNFLFLMYSRLGLNDTFLTFLLILTLFLFHKGLEKGLYLFLTGIFSFGVYVCKASAAYFILVVLISLLFAFYQKSPGADKKRIMLPLSLFISGLTTALLIWFVFFFWPNHSVLTGYGAKWVSVSIPESIHRLFVNLGTPRPFEYFFMTPVVLLICSLYLPFLIYFLINGWRKVNFIEFFALCWLVGGYLSINSLNYVPLRYIISLLPPLCILSAFALSRLMGLYPASVRRRGRPLFIIFTSLWTLFIIKLAIRYLGPRGSIGLIFVFLALLAFFYVIQFLFYRNKLFSRKAYVDILLLSTIVLSLIINARLYLKWVLSPRFTVINTSRELGRLLDNAYIAGLWAPVVCLNNQHKALLVGKDWYNDKDIFKRFPITHLLLWDGNKREEPEMFESDYPEVMKRAREIRVYNIKGFPVRLFEIK